MQAGWDTLQTIFALVLAILAATMSTGPVIRREVSDYLLAVFDPASTDLIRRFRGCRSRAARPVTNIESVSSQPVRRIVLRE